MQYNVPQFTETEDKIVGPLSIKQFLLLMGAGGAVFLTYSVTKSIPATVIAGFLLGLPALALAFGQFNGRYLYQTIGVFVTFFTSPKVYVFQKESKSSIFGAAAVFGSSKKSSAPLSESTLVHADEDVHSRLRRVQYQLEQRQTQEKELVEGFKK